MLRMVVDMYPSPLSKGAHRVFVRVRLAIVAAFVAAVYCASLCQTGPASAPLGRDVVSNRR